MGSESSKPSGVTKQELHQVLDRERRFTEAKLRREISAQQAARHPEPSGTEKITVTEEELNRALERERKLTEERLRREFLAQQATLSPVQQAAVPLQAVPLQPTASAQPCNLYPQLNVYRPQPVVEVPCQQSAPSYSRAVPSAPVLVDNEHPKERTGRPFRLTQNIDKNIQCPTCGMVYGTRIYSCLTGHSACEQCKESKFNCGICNMAVLSVRNFAFESHISKLVIPCPNNEEGCCFKIKFSELEAHLKKCPFDEIICPVEGIPIKCSWKGKLSKLAAHFNCEHPEHCAAVNQEMCLSNPTSYSRKLFLATLGKYNFFVHIEVSPNDQKIYMTTQVCGAHNAASNWDYELHLYNKSQPRKKYMYTDVCYPHSTPASDIFASKKCVVIPSIYYMNFMNNGVINYKFYMKKRFDGAKNGNTKDDTENTNKPKQRYNRNRSYNRNKNRDAA